MMATVAETFAERFARLVNGRSDTELGSIMGMTADAVRKLRTGDSKSLKLHAALRLSRSLGISPWDLAGEREPSKIAHLADAIGSRDEQRAAEFFATRIDFDELDGEVGALGLVQARMLDVLARAFDALADAKTNPEDLRQAAGALRQLPRSVRDAPPTR